MPARYLIGTDVARAAETDNLNSKPPIKNDR